MTLRRKANKINFALDKMGKVRYNKKTKQYERDILVNDVPTIVSFPKKEHLEKLSYRLYSKLKEDKNSPEEVQER